MGKIIEEEVAVGPGHVVTVALPPEVTATRVKVIIEPLVTTEETTQPKKRTLSMKYQGLFDVPDSFFDPLTEEELKDWEGADR